MTAASRAASGTPPDDAGRVDRVDRADRVGTGVRRPAAWRSIVAVAVLLGLVATGCSGSGGSPPTAAPLAGSAATANDHSPNDNSANDHSPNDNSANDHSPNDNSPNDNSPNDNSANDHSPNDNSPNDNSANDSSASEDSAASIDDADVELAASAFLAAQSSANARELVGAIDANGGDRWVPWLVDLLRLNVSTQVSNEARQALAGITGIASVSRVPDLVAYGGWAHSRELDGGPGYVDFKATLYGRIDARFPELLRAVADPADVAAMQWGGVPLGGIPELNAPARVRAADADWMVDDEVVLGVVVGDEAVAYPLRIMARHELANDTVGGLDLAVVYCTLCRSALVFERTVEGRRLDFLTSGLLLNSNKVMYDTQTESLWNHLQGTAIGGELTGTVLTVRPVNHLRWSDWISEHPESEVLALPEPIYFDNPERPPIAYDYTPGEAYRSYYESDELWFPVFDTPDTFALKTEVVGIARNGDSVAFDVTAFNERAETTEIEVGGDTLTVEPTGVGVLVFDATGARVRSEQSFWFAWYANHPDTRTLDF